MRTLVTILSCNDYSYTKACIERLFAATQMPFDLLLIDNSFNGDKRVELVHDELRVKYQDRIIYKSHNDKNLGIAISLNEAFDFFLRNNYVYFAQFHIDTYVGPHWLENFYHAFDDYKAEALAPLEQNDHFYFPEVNKKYDRIIQENKLFFDTSEAYIDHLESLFDHGFDIAATEIQEQYKYTLIPNAYSFSSYIMHKDVIKCVGYFDEDFFVGGEDRDYANRMKTRGIRFYKFGGVFTLHWGSVVFINSGNVQGRLANQVQSEHNNKIEKDNSRILCNYCMRKSCVSNKNGKCELKETPTLDCPYYVMSEDVITRDNRQILCPQGVK